MKKNIDYNFKFVVIGGGTAGWLTALFLRNRFKESKITLIENSKIGTSVGVGESTTPVFCTLLKVLDIPITDVIKYADGTIKTAIKFTNWNGDNKHYYHGFSSNILNGFYDDHKFRTLSDYNPFALDAVRKNFSVGEFNLTNIFADQYLSCFNKEFQQIDSGFAMHYNAAKLASYFKKVGVSRNINVVDDLVKDVEQNDKEEITKVVCENNIVDCDFVFDCSGFARLLIGKHYKSEWYSYSHVIPNDTAVPFFIPCNSNIPPFTEAISMDNGWVWKIPTNGRYGCGYVYSSKFTNFEEVKKEIIEKFGDQVDFHRKEPFKFEAGCYKKTWIKNCISLGLAGSFIEPLEATSIMTLITSLFFLLKSFRGITADCEKTKNIYNNTVVQINKDILEFVYFHYLTKRKNNDYWKSFHNVDTEKEQFKVVSEIKKLNGEMPSIADLRPFTQFLFFAYHSWLEVGSGLGLYDSNKADEIFQTTLVGTNLQDYNDELNVLKHTVFLALNDSIKHDKLLEHFTNND